MKLDAFLAMVPPRSRQHVSRLVGLLMLAAAVGGCASAECDPCTNCPEQVSTAACTSDLACGPVMPRPVSGLIFDRQPGLYTADQFAYRGDWPSTLGYFRAPEVIFYRENFYDRQGPGVPLHDSTYRRFQTLRYGHAIR
jgi:hypothetical protein